MPERKLIELGPRRREWSGAGGAVPPGVERLLARGRGGARCQWQGLARRTGRSLDQVDAERMLWRALDSGLVIVTERRTRRGDWEPYQWRLTPAGELVLPERAESAVSRYLSTLDDPSHPVLAAIRCWLERGRGTTTATRIVLAIGEELRAGGFPRTRLLSVRVKGSSKAVQVENHRPELEEALGCPLDQVVRATGRAAFVAGRFSFRSGDVVVDSRGLQPWMAIPIETIRKMDQLSTAATRLLTIENLVPFEEEARVGLPPDTIALWVKGFPGEPERETITRFVSAGVSVIDHWSDLDLGGLRILRFLRSFAPVDVRMFRMEPELLDSMPTLRLLPAERLQIERWLEDSSAPGRELAARILARGRKAEQEAWYLRSVE